MNCMPHHMTHGSLATTTITADEQLKWSKLMFRVKEITKNGTERAEYLRALTDLLEETARKETL